MSSLGLVTDQLAQWADAVAVKAKRANDPDSIDALAKAEAEFRRLQVIVQAAIAELAAYRSAKPAKASRAPRMVMISALEFWRRHGLAVEAVRAAYGDNWKCHAPFGHTELATIPSRWRSFETETGTTLRWHRDARVPSASYWLEGRLPTGLKITPDYPRHVPGVEPLARDAAWHRAHGYVWHGGQWLHEVEATVAGARADGEFAYAEAAD